MSVISITRAFVMFVTQVDGRQGRQDGCIERNTFDSHCVSAVLLISESPNLQKVPGYSPRRGAGTERQAQSVE